MIVTPGLSVDVVRYLDLRTQRRPYQWTALREIADHVYGPVHGPEDLAFSQAVDLARCRGWIIVEGNSPSKRACLTKAGCSLVASARLRGLQLWLPPDWRVAQHLHAIPLQRAPLTRAIG